MSHEEKLSALSQLIAFARATNEITTVEYNFLVAIANQIGVTKEAFDKLLNRPYAFKNLKHESQRIVQFHRLLLLMNIDHVIAPKELDKIHQLGLKMGLNILAIDKTLKVMKNYENNNIPPEVLLDIFKTHYN
ncbi:MAG: TerB family tellurite resistance protein [Flavobacteriaceae bacterium]